MHACLAGLRLSAVDTTSKLSISLHATLLQGTSPWCNDVSCILTWQGQVHHSSDGAEVLFVTLCAAAPGCPESQL